MLYLQKYLTNFEELFSLKDVERGYSSWKFQMHRHFIFGVATLQLFQYPEIVKISIFPITLSQQKCYIFNRIWRILKNLFWLKDQERGSCGWEFEVHRHFIFGVATLQLFQLKLFQYPENVKISIFPITLSQLKCYIFNSDNPIFKNLFLAQRLGTWLSWLKI